MADKAKMNENLYESVKENMKEVSVVSPFGYKKELEDKSGSSTSNETSVDFRDQTYDPTYHPNSEDKQNTGQGAEAALGTEYSWNKKGSDQAQKQYESDVLSQKQSMLTNRQTIANNAVNYQAQSDMMKYQSNQNAEKVGWTGGYVLDQNRQMDYLKASIQAQMYGAIELQKYGYDSSLAAARLSYDLNQEEYAHQYYQEAVQNAMNEAQLTGVYFSAETKDMMSQLAIAQQKLDDAETSDEDKQKAQSLIDTINKWFDSNGVSKEGVKTMAAFQFETQQNYQWLTDQWQRYEAALDVARSDVSTNATMYIMYEGDKIAYDQGEVKTIDMSVKTDAELKDYYNSGETQKQQISSYFQYLLEEIKNSNTKVVNSETGEKKVNQDQINKEAKALAERYKSITGQDLDISKIINGSNSQQTSTSTSHENESRTENDNWDLINKYDAVQNLSELSNFTVYDSNGEPKTESKIQGVHLAKSYGIASMVYQNKTFRNCYFDFNDHANPAWSNHIYLYIDSGGNIYVISRDEMKKPWYFLGADSTVARKDDGTGTYSFKVYQSTNYKDEFVQLFQGNLI